MTPAELLDIIYEAGGTVWISSDLDNKTVIRQIGAPKDYIKQLRSYPIPEVVDAVREHERQLEDVRMWLFAQTIPVRDAQTSIEALIRHYGEWTKRSGRPYAPGLARQILSAFRAENGMIDGLMLASDFIAICKEQRRRTPGRFQPGDVVRCDHYTSYSRLVILQIKEDGDLMVSVEGRQIIFWVVPSDCDLVEPVEHRLGGESDLDPDGDTSFPYGENRT